MLDHLIRNGHVVDGSGDAPKTADVGIADGRIVSVGRNLGGAKRTIDADGRIVAPGWVDIHTHFDGHAVWDPVLAPCVWHGSTTAIVGNCGVGFAPARPHHREYLIEMMSGVEDIPANALRAGLSWEWESFPEYLDAIDRAPCTIDVGAMMTHAAVRLYAMGERAVAGTATAEDLAMMADITSAGIRAGALGLSTSRTPLHVSTNGDLVPGTHADVEELMTLARAVRSGGPGIFELVTEGIAGEVESGIENSLGWMERMATETGCPVTFLLAQHTGDPSEYRRVLDRCNEIHERGVPLHPQVSGKPGGILLSFPGDHPFRSLASFAPVAALEPAARAAALRDSALREQIIAEYKASPPGGVYNEHLWDNVFELGSPFNFYPRNDPSLAAVAAQKGLDPVAMAYDMLLENDATAFLAFFIVNWHDRSDDALFRQITHPASLVGLGDAGAHVMTVSDAVTPTLGLIHWVRDRDRDDPHRMTLQYFVRKMTSVNANFFGLRDRGLIRSGLKADINIIDLDSLSVPDAYVERDLPLGMPRLEQKSKGYDHTIVLGEIIVENGALTGKQPGRAARISPHA